MLRMWSTLFVNNFQLSMMSRWKYLMRNYNMKLTERLKMSDLVEQLNLSDKNRNVVCQCFKDDLGLDIIAQLELSMKWKNVELLAVKKAVNQTRYTVKRISEYYRMALVGSIRV